MKITILSRSSKSYSTQSLTEVAKKRNHEVRMINPLKCYMNINAKKASIYYMREIISDVDAVIPQIKTSIDFSIAIVRQFEMMNVYSVNSSLAISRVKNRLEYLQLLAKKGIRIPITGFTHSMKFIDDLIQMVGGPPLVVLEGSQELEMVVSETKAASSVIQAFHGLKINLLVQELIKKFTDEDIRCFVVGSEVIAAIKCKTQESENITPVERAIAIKAAKVIGLNIASIDLIRSNNGPVILRANSNLCFEGIKKNISKNIAEKVIMFIEKNVKKAN